MIEETTQANISLPLDGSLPVQKNDLLAALPEQSLVTRLVSQNFNSISPAQRKLDKATSEIGLD